MNMPFQLPVDSARLAGFTTTARLLLATTAAFWMGAAQGGVSQAELTRQQSGVTSIPDPARRPTPAGFMRQPG